MSACSFSGAPLAGAARTARRLALAVLACVAVVLLGPSAAWANHGPAPLPSMAPGQIPVPTGWTCHGTSTEATNPSATTDTCQVSGWVLSARPPTPPAVQPVSPAAGTAAFPVSAPTALPVVEQSPQTAPVTVDTCGRSEDDPCMTEWTPATVAAVGVPALALLLVGGVRISQGFRR